MSKTSAAPAFRRRAARRIAFARTIRCRRSAAPMSRSSRRTARRRETRPRAAVSSRRLNTAASRGCARCGRRSLPRRQARTALQQRLHAAPAAPRAPAREAPPLPAGRLLERGGNRPPLSNSSSGLAIIRWRIGKFVRLQDRPPGLLKEPEEQGDRQRRCGEGDNEARDDQCLRHRVTAKPDCRASAGNNTEEQEYAAADQVEGKDFA